MKQLRQSTPTFQRFAAAVILVGAAALTAPVAHAQAYESALRSISPASIGQGGLDGRTRPAILSIAPASVENQPSIVPAVYDPSLGRFVSAVGNGRGAISVSATSAVSVMVSNQSSTVIVGASSNSVPLRAEAVSSPTSTVTTQQISTNVSASGR
ncbi:MAG: hypothetical protein WCL10_16200 [Novosphingobium sp.]|uniref:hypothetical protein n=1 Tax=Novosphingobium sp. TaxID=1874826 RepID=UPI00301603C0